MSETFTAFWCYHSAPCLPHIEVSLCVLILSLAHESKIFQVLEFHARRVVVVRVFILPITWQLFAGFIGQQCWINRCFICLCFNFYYYGFPPVKCYIARVNSPYFLTSFVPYQRGSKFCVLEQCAPWDACKRTQKARKCAPFNHNSSTWSMNER